MHATWYCEGIPTLDGNPWMWWRHPNRLSHSGRRSNFLMGDGHLEAYSRIETSRFSEAEKNAFNGIP